MKKILCIRIKPDIAMIVAMFWMIAVLAFPAIELSVHHDEFMAFLTDASGSAHGTIFFIFSFFLFTAFAAWPVIRCFPSYADSRR